MNYQNKVQKTVAEMPRGVSVTQLPEKGNKKGHIMSDAQKKTRNEYDGHYPPGVSADSVETIKEYGRAMKRLGKRFEFLYDEYQKIEAEFKAAEDLDSKVKILTKRDTKESQIQGVLKTKKALKDRRSKIEEKERASINNATFTPFEF